MPLPIAELLRRREFNHLFMASITDSVAAGLRTGVLAWLLFTITGSSLAVGISFAVRAAPAIVLGPLGGAVADLFNRRLLVILDKLLLAALAAVTGVLYAADLLEPWHLLTLSAAAGGLFAFSGPALLAMLGDSAPHRLMAHANSLRTVAIDLGDTVGPMLAGFLIASAGAEYAFWVGAGGFVITAMLLLRLPRELGEAPVHRPGPIWRELRQGFSFVAHHPSLLWVTIIVLLNNLTGVAIFPLLPEFTATVLSKGSSSGAWVYGLLLALLGAGLLVGSLLVAFTGLPKRKALLLVATGGVWDGLMALFGFQDALWSSLAILFAMGVAGGVWVAVGLTLFQVSAPSTMRGRALSVFLAAMQFAPLGWLLGGAFAEWFGIRTTLIISALASTPIALLGLLLSSNFRRA